MVCGRCGHRGETRSVTRGSILIEIVLWLAFLVPGLIYSIWRLTTRQQACSACGAAELVPETSPRGRELLAKYHPGTSARGADDDLPKGNATRGYVYLAIIAVAAVWLLFSLI